MKLYNLIAFQIIIQYFYHQKGVFPPLLSSLPAPGFEPGTFHSDRSGLSTPPRGPEYNLPKCSTCLAFSSKIFQIIFFFILFGKGENSVHFI